MLTTLFLGFVALMAVIVIWLSTRYLGGRMAFALAAALLGWFGYIGSIGYFGLIQNVTMRPPGPVFLFLPVVAFLVFFIIRLRSASGERAALAFPLWVLIGTQFFRVIVEFFLHELWRAGLIPKMLTYSGANLDIYVGATAPIIAWLAVRLRVGLDVARVWNVVSLLVLANVVVRAILTAPGPQNLIHAEVPNLMIGTYPFMFIPGFFVPLAVVLHVLALRAIGSEKRASMQGSSI